MKKFLLAWLAMAVLAGGGIALSQTSSVPTVSQLGATDLVPVIPGGFPGSQSQYASSLTLAGFTNSLPMKASALIGGDATTNLWQRGTAGTAVTTAVTYGSADRWAYWSGTNTQMKVIRSSTAADLPSGFQYAFKMQRTASQTGVVQMCMLQEVESVNAYQFQNQTAELDFHAYTGANFSAAGSNMTAYIITGTGTDEGVAGSASVAFGLNAGGGGSGGWTGQANATAAVINLGGVSTMGRYAAIATIPTTATEVAVALCYTPVGTAGANDYVAFSGIQLVRNTSLASSASATVGYTCSASFNCTAFDRRSVTLETLLQQRYYFEIDESASSAVVRASCAMSTTSIANCFLTFPVHMRTAPTMTFATGFLASSSAASTSGAACTGLTVSATTTNFGPSPNGVLIDCASSAAFGAAGTAGFLWDAGTGTPSGRIKASAEL